MPHLYNNLNAIHLSNFKTHQGTHPSSKPFLVFRKCYFKQTALRLNINTPHFRKEMETTVDLEFQKAPMDKKLRAGYGIGDVQYNLASVRSKHAGTLTALLADKCKKA